MDLPSDLRSKHEAMTQAMAARGPLLVAFSGGVDSGLVAKVARDALGDRALAVITDAESLPRRELQEAEAFAAEIGIPLRVVSVSELANPNYAANPSNRCYFCRTELALELVKIARTEGFGAIADGVNLSDLGDHRPGIRAMDEARFWHPLVEFGFAKPDVRELAKSLGLSFFDKPSNACLSSRIAYGEPITIDKLRRVEAAEEVLLGLGFRVVRVRSHGTVARIEVPPADVAALFTPENARKVHDALRSLGFLFVAVDLLGYRSGSLNESL